jgi:hypothetical protein
MRLAARGDVNYRLIIMVGAVVAATACGRRPAPQLDGAPGDQRPSDGLSAVAPCELPPGLTTTLPMLAGALGDGEWTPRLEVDSGHDGVSLTFRRASALSSSEVSLRVRGLKNVELASTRLDASRLPSGVTMEVTWSWCGSRECRIDFMARSTDRGDSFEGSVTLEGTPSAPAGVQACVRATDSHPKSMIDPTLETWTLDMNVSARR